VLDLIVVPDPAPEPEPVLQFERIVDIVYEPVPEPAGVDDPDALPDYVVPPEPAAEPPPPPPARGKRRKARPETAEEQAPKPGRGRTKRAAKVREKKLRLQRSAPEPGEENPDLDWMTSLASRLDAYSFTAEDAESDAPEDAEE
jgi:hypothetical protein